MASGFSRKAVAVLRLELTLMQDVIVIGAGPVGLACAIEARHEGLQAAVIEKGALVNSIVGYPANM